mmetsp:Transcript_49533/g.150762  ORF Transcript_49533/g.150762 Transcript_49533/m.150762 type:complete len:307 (-) Transcript_49533:885-1805(-)
MKKPVVLSFFRSGSIVRGPVLSGTLKGSRPSSWTLQPRRSGRDRVMSTLPNAEPKGKRGPMMGGSVYLAFLPFSMGAGTSGGIRRCVVSLHVSTMNFRRRPFSRSCMSCSTASDSRLPSMFWVAPMASRCIWSRVRPYSSLRMPYNLSRIPSGNVSWWWMQHTVASKIACVSCGLSSRITRAAGGPRWPRACPGVPKSIGFGASSGNAADTPALAVVCAISSAVAMTSGKWSSTAAVSSTASNCASFSLSFLPALLRSCSRGLLRALVHARRCPAARSGGTSGIATPRSSSSVYNSRKDDVPCLRL